MDYSPPSKNDQAVREKWVKTSETASETVYCRSRRRPWSCVLSSVSRTLCAARSTRTQCLICVSKSCCRCRDEFVVAAVVVVVVERNCRGALSRLTLQLDVRFELRRPEKSKRVASLSSAHPYIWSHRKADALYCPPALSFSDNCNMNTASSPRPSITKEWITTQNMRRKSLRRGAIRKKCSKLVFVAI